MAAKKGIHGRPFKPTNPSKKGYQKTFQHPRYMPQCDTGGNIRYIFEKQRLLPWK